MIIIIYRNEVKLEMASQAAKQNRWVIKSSDFLDISSTGSSQKINISIQVGSGKVLW